MSIENKLHEKLYAAIEEGDTQSVTSLLKNKGIATAFLDDEENTPLHLAVYYDHTDIVKILLNSGLKPEHVMQPNEYGQTALAYAAENKNKKLIELIIDAMQLSLEKLKALIITCLKNRCNEVAKGLIARLNDEQLQSANEDGSTLLIQAAKYGNQPIAKVLIARVPIEHIVQKDKEDKTALIWAARSGSKAVVKLIISKLDKEQIAAKDNTNKNALMHAICAGHPEIFELLSSCSQPFTKQEIFALLQAIAQKSNQAILSFAGPLCDASELITDGDGPEYRKQLIKGEKGRAKIVTMLLQDESKATFKDEKKDLVTVLLQAGLQQDKVWMQQDDEQIGNAIHKAIMAGDVRYLALFLSRLNAKQLQLQDEDGWTPFMRALYEHGYYSEKYKNVVDLFLPHLDALTPQELLLQSKNGDTAFLFAARYESYEAIKYLISRLSPAQINVADHNGWTALIHASNLGYYKIAHLIVQAGLTPEQISIKNNNGYTALMKATGVENKIVKLLLNSGLSLKQINIQNKYGWTAFMYAATRANEELVSLFLKAGLTWNDVSNARDKRGRTVLMYAAQNGDVNFVRPLLTHFSEDEINAQDEQGTTAFMYAIGALKNVRKIVDLFLKKDTQCAWATIQDKQGETALMNAVNYINESLVALFLSKLSPEQMRIKDTYGWTAFMHAIKKGNNEIIKLFIKRGFSLREITNTPDYRNDTILMYAAINGNVKVIQSLLPHLSMQEVQAEDADGETALLMAAESKKHEAFSILLSHINKFTKTEKKHLLWRAYTGDNKDIFQLILKNKADEVSFDTLNWCNDSLLMDATIAEKTWIIEILLPYLSREQILLKNDIGETIFDLTSSEKIKKMIQDRLDELGVKG